MHADHSGSHRSGFVRIVPCSVCGAQAARVELNAPGETPAAFTTWTETMQSTYQQHSDLGSWRFSYEGVEAGNGMGDRVTEERVLRLQQAFSLPLTYASVRSAGLFDDAGSCTKCEQPHCYSHWNNPSQPRGTCPRGHSRALDPHWSPD